jgi:glutathione synthase/RimK-type ligase-like ATP-grasp enzyme
MIVIVSSYVDPHVEAVMAELDKAGTQYLRIDLGAAFYDYEIRFSIAGDPPDFSLGNRRTGLIVRQNEITSVWWRRTNSVRDEIDGITTSANADIKETRNVLIELFSALAETYYPLGHPTNLRRADNKCLQYVIASRAGLSLPRTTFSNSQSELLAFIDPVQEYVVKTATLHSVAVEGNEQSFYAKGFGASELIDAIKNSIEGACLIQERIHRDYDVRLNMLPNATIGTKIYVNDLPEGEVDWRPTTMERQHEPVEIPTQIERKCQQFLDELRIPAGAFDFIVDHDGKWWFLECNPAGQWLWIQQKTGQNIARQFAHLLQRTAPT